MKKDIKPIEILKEQLKAQTMLNIEFSKKFDGFAKYMYDLHKRLEKLEQKGKSDVQQGGNGLNT